MLCLECSTDKCFSNAKTAKCNEWHWATDNDVQLGMWGGSGVKGDTALTENWYISSFIPLRYPDSLMFNTHCKHEFNSYMDQNKCHQKSK